MPDGEGGAQGWCYIVPPRVIDGKWIWSSQKQQTANAALIVYAVNNLPALLSRVAALQTALRDVIEGAIETGSADHCAHIARTALREPQRPRQSAR